MHVSGSAGLVGFKSAQTRPNIGNSSSWKSDQTRARGSARPGVLRLMTGALALTQISALDPTVCDSGKITAFGEGMDTRITSARDALLTQPSLYIATINTTDHALHRDLTGLKVMMDNCIATPSGASQFSGLQACSAELFSSATMFSSPLIGLNGTLHSTFDSNYDSESRLSWAIVPYTRDNFTPLTEFFLGSANAYISACHGSYNTAKANQTAAAIVARTDFLKTVTDGFSPINTLFENGNLGLSATLLADLSTCQNQATASSVLSCLTAEQEPLTSESNRLYGLITSLFSGVNSLETSTPALDSFSYTANLNYRATCSQSMTLYRSAQDCGWVPPTDTPSARPTVHPTSGPTSGPTSVPSSAPNSPEKENCEKEGIPVWVFGTTVAGVGTLLGLAGYYLGVTRTEKRIQDAAIQKAAHDNSLEALEEAAPVQNRPALGTIIQGAMGILMPYIQPWVSGNDHAVVTTAEYEGQL